MEIFKKRNVCVPPASHLAPNMRRPFIVSADPATPDEGGLVTLSDFAGKAFLGTITALTPTPHSDSFPDLRLGLMRVMREAFVNGYAGICDVKIMPYTSKGFFKDRTKYLVSWRSFKIETEENPPAAEVIPDEFALHCRI